jgi:hypothetical protein
LSTEPFKFLIQSESIIKKTQIFLKNELYFKKPYGHCGTLFHLTIAMQICGSRKIRQWNIGQWKIRQWKIRKQAGKSVSKAEIYTFCNIKTIFII